MGKYKSHEKYIDSNVAWIGKIPVHWKPTYIKGITKTYSEKGKPELELLSVYRDYGVIKKSSRDDNHNKPGMDLSSYKVVYPNSLVLNKMKTWSGSMGVSNYLGIVSPAYITCKIDLEQVETKYLNYLLRCKNYVFEYNRLSYGVRPSQWDMRYQDFKSIPIFLPPKEEQTAIARFLDYKLAKINRFIQKKKQLIKLLNEQKAAIINQAVTKGLDPNAKMKDSGIEWLGEIPEHWEVKPIKYFVTCNDESLTDKTDKDYQLRYIDIGNVDSNGNVSEIVSYKFKDAPSRARRIVKAGDIIVSTIRTYLKAIMHIKGYTENLIVSTGFAVLRPRKNIFSEFLNYAIRANYFIGKVVSESNGVSYPAINSTELITLKIAIPLIDEQKEIVQFIDIETKIINTTISKIEKELALTEEYKTALIAEAVTGKIDVRGYEVPEISEEETYEEIEEEISMAAEDEETYQNIIE
jgi:type I restriction enzyme, S subunit